MKPQKGKLYLVKPCGEKQRYVGEYVDQVWPGVGSQQLFKSSSNANNLHLFKLSHYDSAFGAGWETMYSNPYRFYDLDKIDLTLITDEEPKTNNDLPDGFWRV